MGLPWAARGGGCSATGGTEAEEEEERRDSAADGLKICLCSGEVGSQGDSVAAVEVVGPDADSTAGAATADGRLSGVVDGINSRLIP